MNHHHSGGTYNIPPRKLNGGLYTGEPFQKDAPWANVPVIPDSGYMTFYNLRSANPPAQALTQYQPGDRGGNNPTYQPHSYTSCLPLYGIACNKVIKL